MANGRKFELLVEEALRELKGVPWKSWYGDSKLKHRPDFTINQFFIECKSAESKAFSVRTWLKSNQYNGIEELYPRGMLVVENAYKKEVDYSIHIIETDPFDNFHNIYISKAEFKYYLKDLIKHYTNNKS